MPGLPRGKRGPIAFERFLMDIEYATRATFAAALGGIRFGRTQRRGIGGGIPGRAVVRHDVLRIRGKGTADCAP